MPRTQAQCESIVVLTQFSGTPSEKIDQIEYQPEDQIEAQKATEGQ
jgi:hypothetical protein